MKCKSRGTNLRPEARLPGREGVALSRPKEGLNFPTAVGAVGSGATDPIPQITLPQDPVCSENLFTYNHIWSLTLPGSLHHSVGKSTAPHVAKGSLRSVLPDKAMPLL